MNSPDAETQIATGGMEANVWLNVPRFRSGSTGTQEGSSIQDDKGLRYWDEKRLSSVRAVSLPQFDISSEPYKLWGIWAGERQQFRGKNVVSQFESPRGWNAV